MKKNFLLIFICICLSHIVIAQDDFEKFRQQANSDYSTFGKKSKDEFNDFRSKANKDYANFIKEAWSEFNSLTGVPLPIKDKPISPTPYIDDKNVPVKSTPKPIESITKPNPIVITQPEPIAPIKDIQQPIENLYYFDFYNTRLKVRLDKQSNRFYLKSCDGTDVANAWNLLSSEKYNNLIKDCLYIRSEYNLCDWAYLLMLYDLSNNFLGKSNESVLLTAYIYCQSGYKIRLATKNNKLYLLYASNYTIYDKNYWDIDGIRYYTLDANIDKLNICKAAYPEEKPLSLQVATEQKFNVRESNNRLLKSKRYPDVQVSVSTNNNLIDFFNSYPTSSINNDFGTRWAMYANTPLSSNVKESLYPILIKAINNKTKLESVNIILNFVQTAFVYKLDDDVWGGDRAFFPDETIYYPYCDCEDCAILFSRIIRDILGLNVVLIYYPGHLATAVNFNESVNGDYIELNGRKYTICDPTYINAPVGATMPDMDNGKAKVILLE